MTVVAVCGMSSEAALIGQRPDIVTVIGAGDPASLASKLEAAILAEVIRIISIGVCGALAPDLQVGEIVIGVSVCDESGAIIHSDKDWTRRLYRALIDGPKPVTFPMRFSNFASTSAPVATVAARAALQASTGADCVDMESWIAASAAKAHGLPFAILRAVLDTSSFDLPPVALLPLKPDGSNDIFAIIGSLMGDLGQGEAVLQLARWSQLAMGNLAVALVAIGRNFAAYGA